jgi:hypothetical protein
VWVVGLKVEGLRILRRDRSQQDGSTSSETETLETSLNFLKPSCFLLERTQNTNRADKPSQGVNKRKEQVGPVVIIANCGMEVAKFNGR